MREGGGAMMTCPACAAPLVSGEARCVSCRALVNPASDGSSALAPRLVTPQSIEGLSAPSEPPPSIESQILTPIEPRTPESRNSEDEAWRREVLERVRKRRQVRTHALPLFVDGQKTAEPEEVPAVIAEAFVPTTIGSTSPQAYSVANADLDGPESLDADDLIESADSRQAARAPDLLSSLDVPLDNVRLEDGSLDLQLRPAESSSVTIGGSHFQDTPSQSLFERVRPKLVTGPVTRSLVADLPLVEPTRLDVLPAELPPRTAPAVSSRAASINDRIQAAFIDIGIWSAMSATAFYFASRIARTSIFGLGPAWQGLALFGTVLAAAYILFFGGLSGATPGKIACGIHVKRYDGSSLGPLGSLARGFLGILGVAFLGIGIWPAFWDKDRRGLHDRVTDSRVTTV